MTIITKTSSGQAWREITTVEEAIRVGSDTKTAFGVYFKRERELGGEGRYFALESNDVIGRMSASGQLASSCPYDVGVAPHFVTLANADPFPNYAKEIDELAKAIGVEITSQAYPHGRPAHSDDEAPSLNGS
jgi:hypothetical protein